MARRIEGCETGPAPTPEPIHNRPGLSRIEYRVGDYASFRAAMLRQLARERRLDPWTARTSDDFGVALLEMWAYLCDILTFYQERYVNEVYLRTAEERDSLVRLAALIDYRPKPGVAASTPLALTIKSDESVSLAEGLRVKSVPAPGEKAQKFETIEPITAYGALNRIGIRGKAKDENPLAIDSTGGPLATPGLAKRLVPRDQLIAFSEKDNKAEERRVEKTEEGDWGVLLHWSPPLSSEMSAMFRWRRKFRLFGRQAPKHYQRIKLETDEEGVKRGVPKDRTTDFLGDPQTLMLDGSFDIALGTPVLIVVGSTVHKTEVDAIAEGSGKVGPLENSVTKITLKDAMSAGPDVREVVIYELAEQIEFAGETWSEQLALEPGAAVTLLDAIPKGVDLVDRAVIVADDRGQAAVARIAARDNDTVTLDLGEPITLHHASAHLLANVAAATHGETIAQEVLGDGDASAVFQSFVPKKAPVTFVADDRAPGGAASTIRVYVDGVAWHDVLHLLGNGPSDRVYTQRIDGEGAVTLGFGDKKTGARLPTGKKNVTATYRVGLGTAGIVRAGAITKLLDKPLGLQAVRNPLATVGGAAAEGAASLRANAPNTIRTFERIVSLRDFEDAAREFVGVEKARAIWAWDRPAAGPEGADRERIVRLIVGGVDGTPVNEEGLRAYLDARRDTNRTLELTTYDPEEDQVPIRVEARVAVHPDHLEAKVPEAVMAALADFFAYANRDFGQAVFLSDVVAALQGVEGVIAVDIDVFSTGAGIQARIPIDAGKLAVLHEDSTVEAGEIPE